MGRRNNHHHPTKSHTLPSSPTHSSSSSSDFEFTISLSPRKSSAALCPADELFYKGQLLPLHLSPRLSMVRTLLLASSSTSSSSDTTTTASRDSHSSTDSHSSSASELLLLNLPDCDSSRPSSATDDEFGRLTTSAIPLLNNNNNPKKSSKYFSLSRFSSVFRKEPKNQSSSSSSSSSSVKRMSANAREVIRKYLKRVKPLYEKLSQKQQQHQQKMPPLSRISRSANVTLCMKGDGSIKESGEEIHHQYPRKESSNVTMISHSFSGNLRYPRRRNCIISSCPSSMRSSPSHSGILSKSGSGSFQVQAGNRGLYGYSDSSSMEELQSAIQGAIAHCKSSMLQNKTMVSNEI